MHAKHRMSSHTRMNTLRNLSSKPEKVVSMNMIIFLGCTTSTYQFSVKCSVHISLCKSVTAHATFITSARMLVYKPSKRAFRAKCRHDIASMSVRGTLRRVVANIGELMLEITSRNRITNRESAADHSKLGTFNWTSCRKEQTKIGDKLISDSLVLHSM